MQSTVYWEVYDLQRWIIHDTNQVLKLALWLKSMLDGKVLMSLNQMTAMQVLGNVFQLPWLQGSQISYLVISSYEVTWRSKFMYPQYQQCRKHWRKASLLLSQTLTEVCYKMYGWNWITVEMYARQYWVFDVKKWLLTKHIKNCHKLSISVKNLIHVFLAIINVIIKLKTD